MVRIDDVARLAEVSTATVSRALRGVPVVSAQTRARVLQAAAALGYVASPSASRLAGGRTGAIGFVVPQLTRWFFATVVEAAEPAVSRAGYDLILYHLGGREEARSHLFDQRRLEHRVDALLLVATPLRESDLQVVAGLNLPGVTVGSGTSVPCWPGIRIDDRAAARTATEHLLSLGHTRIAHLAGTALDGLACTTHADRRAGYQAALRAAGIEPDPVLEVAAEFTVSGGEQAIQELLGRNVVPTAVFAACDEMAMGALRALRRAGFQVPGDVSVIGIDDHDAAAVVGLTTVAQPVAAQGRLAAALLLEALRAGPVAPRRSPVRPVLLPTNLVIRESTAPPGHP